MKEPFLSAIPVLQKLEKAGFEAFFVGGSVRDYLLGNIISDVDIATSATPLEVKKIFPKTVDIGIEHGTVLVLFNHQSYEVTTFRTEAEYIDYRRPKEVEFIRNLNEDLQRRDFTMNAIAMDRNGKLLDPFNGQAAIRDKVIQTVGPAIDRFQEDALRMMRAVRFVSQLSFHIESNTIEALRKLIPLLGKIAVERKRVEFEKTLVGKNFTNALKMLLDTKLFVYLPGLSNHEIQLEQLLSFHYANLNKKEMWSLLLYCLGIEKKSIELFLREWRLPIKEIREIQLILEFLKKRLTKEWSAYDLFSAGVDTITSVEKLYLVINGQTKIESIQYWLDLFERLPIQHRSEMDVTGNDLMNWYNKGGGPWLRDTLLDIERAIIDGLVDNDNQMIKEWLSPCSQK